MSSEDVNQRARVGVGIAPSKTFAKRPKHMAKKHPRSKGAFNSKTHFRKNVHLGEKRPVAVELGCWSQFDRKTG